MKLLTNLSAALLLAAILLFNCCKKENLNPVKLHKPEAGNTINTTTASDSSHTYSACKARFLVDEKGSPTATFFSRNNNILQNN